MRIDIHAHYFPPDYLDYLARFENPDRVRAITITIAPGARVTLDERLEMFDKAGIDVQVLSVGSHVPYFPNEVDAVEAARLGNDRYNDICRRYGGRFAAFATVPLPHVQAAVAEVGRGLDTLGMVGVTVGCSVAGRPLDDPAFDPFFAELDRRAAVLFLHPVGVGGGPGSADYGLPWMVGAPFEDTITVLRLVLSGLTSRYSRIRIIVPHLGGTLPFLLQRLDDHFERMRLAGARTGIDHPPSTYVRRLWFDTVNEHPAALRCACESFGASRLMLGTDFPYLAGPKFQRCVTYVQDAGLTEKEVAAILDQNAQALLGLGTK